MALGTKVCSIKKECTKESSLLILIVPGSDYLYKALYNQHSFSPSLSLSERNQKKNILSFAPSGNLISQLDHDSNFFFSILKTHRTRGQRTLNSTRAWEALILPLNQECGVIVEKS